MPTPHSCPRCGRPVVDPIVGCQGCTPAYAENRARQQESAAGLESDDRYQVLETLGSGGMGVVYKAIDREIDEVIAIKVLDEHLCTDRVSVEGFKREIKIARRINHPNVARLYHLFRWHDRLAISQEFIAGSSLDKLMDDKPVSPAELVALTRYLGSGLHAAHGLGIIHRDLKPGNIVIGPRGRPYIVDFGLAILNESLRGGSEETRWTVGTPAYMSPEQAASPESIDHRSDIYSLGVLLFRLAVGCLPFLASDPRKLMAMHVSATPPRPSELNAELTKVFDDVLLRCLEKRPEARYASALDIHRDLAEATPVATNRPTKLGSRGTVLVVDDDPETRALICAVIENLEVRTLQAANGRDAVATAIALHPDFILLDIQMPVLDGRGALEQLKADPRTADTPVAMLTGLTRAEAFDAKGLGAAVFLNKPVQPDVLELLVERYLK